MDVTRFITRDQRTVDLEWSDDDQMTVWTTTSPREEIGRFLFRFIEGASDRGDDDFWLLTHMHLEGPPSAPGSYQRQGIGREIIAMVGDDVTPVAFTPDDGITRDDGSHLTGDGPGFARRMVAAKLACWNRVEGYDD